MAITYGARMFTIPSQAELAASLMPSHILEKNSFVSVHLFLIQSAAFPGASRIVVQTLSAPSLMDFHKLLNHSPVDFHAF